MPNFRTCAALLVALAFVLFTHTSTAQTVEEDAVQHLEVSEVGPFRPEHDPELGRVAELIVESTNEFRKKNDLPAVSTAPRLQQTALDFANFMAEKDKYGHRADGKRPADRAREHDYDYCIVSENIAYQFRTTSFATATLAGKFVTGWKNSPPHRKNMLDPDVTETGVAVAQSAKTGVFYAVQMFGRPQAEAIQFKVANRTRSTAEYNLGDQTFSLPMGYIRTHQMCRPAELALSDKSAAEPKAFQPGDGETFFIERGDGETFQLVRDQASQ